MTDRAHDESIGDAAHRELRSLLAEVGPSPAFAAGVRERIAAGRVRSEMNPVFAWAAAGTVCASVCLGVLVARHLREGAVVTQAVAAPATRATEAARTVERAASVVSPRRAAHVVAPQIRTTALEAPVRSADGRVLVPDDQRVALIRLLWRVGEGRAVVPQRLRQIYDKDGLIVPPPPVVVAPLEALAPPDPNDVDGGSNTPKPRKDER